MPNYIEGLPVKELDSLNGLSGQPTDGLGTSIWDTSITTLPSEAVYDRDQNTITKVVISDGIEYIGGNVFWRSLALEEIQFPSSLKGIGERTFEDCKLLKNIKFPKSITEIKYGAFSGCASLEHVDFPESINSIDSSAFGYCTALKEVYIPSNVEYIGYRAFTHAEVVNCNFAEKPEDWQENWVNARCYS